MNDSPFRGGGGGSDGGNGRTDAPGILPEAEAFIGKWIGHFTNLMAIIGGLVLTAVMLLAVASIIGRALSRLQWPIFSGLGPIPGDFELVAMGTGMSIFLFLSWAQFNRGHVTVDIFVSKLGPRGLAWLSTVTNLIMTVMVVILAQRIGEGMASKQRFGEITQILEIPVWYGYLGGMFGLWAFALVCAYTVWRSLNEALGAGEPAGGGA
ncbi:MAG: TRAP transporter small permease [Pararhodobacter sp.]